MDSISRRVNHWSQDLSASVVIDPSHVHFLLEDLMVLILPYSEGPPFANDHFFAHSIHTKLKTMQQVFDYCLTSAFATESQKATCMERLLEAVTPCAGNPIFSSVLHPALTRLMVYRIADGPKVEWKAPDDALAVALRQISPSANPTAEVSLILETLREESWDISGDPLKVSAH